MGLPKKQDEDGRIIYPVLRQRLRPERRHIIPSAYPHRVSENPVEAEQARGVAREQLVAHGGGERAHFLGRHVTALAPQDQARRVLDVEQG